MLGHLPGHMDETRHPCCHLHKHYFRIIQFSNLKLKQKNKCTIRKHSRMFFMRLSGEGLGKHAINSGNINIKLYTGKIDSI